MRIGKRIFGGFSAALLLTSAVAAVSWQSLNTFEKGAATANASERLSTDSSRLALAALSDQSAEKPQLMRDSLARVRQAIERLGTLGQGKADVEEAIRGQSAAVTSVEQGAARLDQQELSTSALQASHARLVAESVGAVEVIAKAQRERLEAALKALDGAQTEQSQLSNLGAVMGHATRLAYEMRLGDDQMSKDEEIQKVRSSSMILGALLRKISAVPELAEAIKPGLDAAIRYREVLVAIEGGRDRQRELSPLSDKVIAALNAVDGEILNIQSGIRTRMSEVRDQVGRGTELLTVSGAALVAAKTVEVEEMELIKSGAEKDAQEMDAAAGQLIDAIEDMRFKITDPEVSNVVQTLRTKVADLRKSIPDMLKAKRDSNELKSRLSTTVAGMVSRAQQLGATQIREMESGRQQALWLLAVGVASALLIGVCLAFFIGRGITRPLNALVDSMRKLVAGDLSAEVPGESRKDELGEMAKAVMTFKEAAVDKRRMELEAAEARKQAEDERKAGEAAKAEAARKQALVVTSIAEGLSNLAAGDLRYRLETAFASEYEQLRTDFNAAVDTLHTTVQTIAHTATSIRSGTGEIRQAADDLSHRTEQQAAALEQSAAALDEISSTTKKAAGSAGHAKGLVGTAASEADRSGEIVREAIAAMGKIEASSGKIANIVSVIDEIAFQTNLLALNAGVEAARAGDTGKGFAVVAQEVRSLAQRSAEAAKEIEALIRTSSGLVTDGVKLVNQTGDALMRISGHVGQISVAVTDIASSAEDQAVGLGEVNSAVSQMGQVTQQNAAMVEESTAASHSLAGEAEELDRLLGHFKLTDAAPHRVAAAPQAAQPARKPARPRAAARMPEVRGNLALAPRPDDWEEF